MKNPLKKILDQIRGEQNLEKLIKRGLTVGKDFNRMGGVIIDPSHCWHISIGNNVTLAPRVHILAHDASTKLFLNHTRVSNVVIGDNVFIGAGTIILPGVTIGNNVVIGAGSLVSRNIPDDCVDFKTVIKNRPVILLKSKVDLHNGLICVFGKIPDCFSFADLPCSFYYQRQPVFIIFPPGQKPVDFS